MTVVHNILNGDYDGLTKATKSVELELMAA